MAKEHAGQGTRNDIAADGQLPEIKTDGFHRWRKLQAYPPFYLDSRS
jgi:hypothetical protein